MIKSAVAGVSCHMHETRQACKINFTANSADNKLMIVFLSFPEIRIDIS